MMFSFTAGAKNSGKTPIFFTKRLLSNSLEILKNRHGVLFHHIGFFEKLFFKELPFVKLVVMINGLIDVLVPGLF